MMRLLLQTNSSTAVSQPSSGSVARDNVKESDTALEPSTQTSTQESRDDSAQPSTREGIKAFHLTADQSPTEAADDDDSLLKCAPQPVMPF